MEEHEARHLLTADEAREVSLSWWPLRRLGQLAELGSAYHTRSVGMSPLPFPLSRWELVQVAKAHDQAYEDFRILESLPQAEGEK